MTCAICGAPSDFSVWCSKECESRAQATREDAYSGAMVASGRNTSLDALITRLEDGEQYVDAVDEAIAELRKLSTLTRRLQQLADVWEKYPAEGWINKRAITLTECAKQLRQTLEETTT